MPANDPNFPSNLSITASKRSAVRLASTTNGEGSGSEEEDASQDVETFGIAGRTWEAAYFLRHYITPPPPPPSLPASPSSPTQPIFDPPCPLFTPPSFPSSSPASSRPNRPKRRTILELGSGTGFLSLSLAPHLSPSTDRLVLTDLENVCPLLEKNLGRARGRWRKRREGKGKEKEGEGMGELEVLVRPLPWGDEAFLRKLLAEERGKRPDFILASDLIYFEFLYAPLLRTLIGLTSTGGVEEEEWEQEGESGTTVIFSYKVRSLTREQPFWEAFGRWFSFTPVQLGTPSAPSPPSSPSSPPPCSSTARPPPPQITSWTRFGSSLPAPTSSNPTGTDELYIFICRRWASTLSSFSLNSLEGVSDEDLLQGRGAGRGCEDGAGQFEEMLLLGQEWDW